MEENKKEKKQWGGRRAGSGRKKTIEGTTHKISTAVSDEVYNWIVAEAKMDGITTSAFIFRTLQERMKSDMEAATLLSDASNWTDQ
jgi:hypothetical protein